MIYFKFEKRMWECCYWKRFICRHLICFFCVVTYSIIQDILDLSFPTLWVAMMSGVELVLEDWLSWWGNVTVFWWTSKYSNCYFFYSLREMKLHSTDLSFLSFPPSFLSSISFSLSSFLPFSWWAQGVLVLLLLCNIKSMESLKQYLPNTPLFQA